MVCKCKTVQSIYFSLVILFLLFLSGCISPVNYDDCPWNSDRFSAQRDGKVLEASVTFEKKTYTTRVVSFDLHSYAESFNEIGALIAWGKEHGFDLNSGSYEWNDKSFWNLYYANDLLYIFCNMLSVMDGFEPVYYDSTGQVITSCNFDRVYTKPSASGWFLPHSKKDIRDESIPLTGNYRKITWSIDGSTLSVQGVPINELKFTDNSFSTMQSLFRVDSHYSEYSRSYLATNLQMVILRRVDNDTAHLPFVRNSYSIPEGFIASGNTYLPNIEIAIIPGMKESNLYLSEYYTAKNLSFNYTEYIEPIVASRAVFFEDNSRLDNIECRLFANMLSEIDGLTPVYNGYSGEPLCSTSQANAWYAVHTDGWYSLMSERNYYTESIKEYLKANGIDNSVQEIFFRFR